LVQGLETVIDAADRLRGSNVRIVLVGDGSDRVRLGEDARRRNLSNVVFAGRHPASAMPDFYRAADALLVHLRPSLIAGIAIPTKVLAYLAAGKPVVCAVPGATAELIRDAGAGPVLPPGHPQALADAILDLAGKDPLERRRLGENGRRYLAEHFRREHVIDEYESTLREVGAPVVS
jgi:glycosyltransferase involved in cell wall biosynthesis